MLTINNDCGISLPVCVWALQDNYEHDHNSISATTLLKPVRQLILSGRVTGNDNMPIDIDRLLAPAFGNAWHSSIESAWKNDDKRSKALRIMGFTEDTISCIKINPEPSKLTEYDIPIYLENRMKRVCDGITISGQYDMVVQGRLYDFKSTSTFSWVKGNNDKQYQLQGSIYRWLDAGSPNPIIEDDEMSIVFFFTNWNKSNIYNTPNYPISKSQTKNIKLLSLDETEAWIKERLSTINQYLNAPESAIPKCTNEELWISEITYKYYKDPTKVSGRSTRTFDTFVEAAQYKANLGGVGIITESIAKPKRCSYCSASPICSQRAEYYPDLKEME